MELRIVNAESRYRPPSFDEPPQSGWLYLAAAVAPPSGPPFVRRNAGRSALLARLEDLAQEAQRLAEVRQVSVYRGVLIPPAGRDVPRPARFDVAVLVETTTPEVLDAVAAAAPVTGMRDALHCASSTVQVMAARCARFLGAVDRTRPGLFLFNHFTAASPDVDRATTIALWEHLAGWYVTETGLTNSTLLEPIGPSDYLLVNHARWDTGLARFAAAQFLKPTFRSYVRANLRVNQIVAMPVLYRLA